MQRGGWGEGSGMKQCRFAKHCLLRTVHHDQTGSSSSSQFPRNAPAGSRTGLQRLDAALKHAAAALLVHILCSVEERKTGELRSELREGLQCHSSMVLLLALPADLYTSARNLALPGHPATSSIHKHTNTPPSPSPDRSPAL